MSSIRHPADVQDVVALVRSLYEPRSPAELAEIQDVLQQVQRSAEGWTLADSLLGFPEQNVQFFGALTFTVKLNNDWQTLAENDIPALQGRLVGWFVSLVNHGAPQLVLKKMCSTLVVFFLRFPETWPACIRHLICCLSVGQLMPPTEFPSLPASEQLLSSLSADTLVCLLWFAETLVEEIAKVDSSNIRTQHYHIKIRTNLDEMVGVLRYCLEKPAGTMDVDTRVIEAALKTFQAWVLYSLRAWLDTAVKCDSLKSLTQPAMRWLTSEDLFETAGDVFTDLISHYFAFFTAEDSHALSELLTSTWAVERYERLLAGDSDWDAVQFSRLLVAFGEATVQQLVKNLHTPYAASMMQMLHGILNIPGYPQVDEDISGTTFEFWGSLVEYLLESQHQSSEADNSWVADGKREISRAVDEFWRKTRVPGQEVSRWNKDERDGFMSFRKDAADFVESVYGLLGPALLERLVTQALTSLAETPRSTAWSDVEASLFCLSALSDCVEDDTVGDACLERLFGSELFVLLADLSSEIPLKTRTTSVALIGSYAPFFERRPALLPAVLNFLFSCISTTSLARNASKSICSLCSSCRATLTGELTAFLYQYNNFASTSSADDTAKERVLCAIAFVIQALPSDQAKVEPIDRLLKFVERDVQDCLVAVSHGKEAEGKEIGLLVMRCLAAIGRGLQAPDDVIVIIDEHEQSFSSFWEAGTGAALQSRIVDLIKMLVFTLGEDGEIIDAACAVFRTGFAETSPGLFVFPPNVVAQFLLERGRNYTRVETVLSTASTLISSYSSGGSKDISSEATGVFDFVLELVDHIKDPQVDPEISQGMIEVLARMLRRYINIIINYEAKQRIEALFLFLLDSLSVRETLVKKSAAGFWSTLLSVSNLSQQYQAPVDDLISVCGPVLAQKLVWAVGGGCARSEIDGMTEPLKKLVVRHVRAKSWLSEALARLEVSNTTVSPKERQVFLEKIISLRGKRGTNQVTKDFWLKCRGSDFAYAS